MPGRPDRRQRRAQRLVSTSIHRLIYEYLTNYDPGDARPIPGLATAWSPSPDKLTWTYTIRKDSTWSDGRPVTAEDAAWTFDRMMKDPNAATANGSFTANFAAVTAPDPGTLVIRLKQPQANMTALDVPIVPKHIWEKVGDFSTFNNDTAFPIVGNGPFVLTDFKVDQYIRLKPNKDFWRGAPKLDELVFRYNMGGDAAGCAAASGRARMAGCWTFRILCHATDPNDKAVGKYPQDGGGGTWVSGCGPAEVGE